MSNSRDVGVLIQTLLETSDDNSMDVFSWEPAHDSFEGVVTQPGLPVGRVYIHGISAAISPSRIMITTSDNRTFIIQVFEYTS